jgi:group I intron endonuclease
MYIGKTVNLYKRKSTHLWKLKNGLHPNNHIQSAFNKYGKENFEFVILEMCSESKLNEKEIYYIEYYDSIVTGYNQTKGGEGALGRTVTEDTKLKISSANKGRKENQETRKRKSEISKKLWSIPEYRKKMINRPKPTSVWNKGRKRTEEEKRHLSEIMKGRLVTDEHKQKLRELYKGSNSLSAKLTENDVINIRLRFLKGERQCDICKDYPVTPQTIYDIVRCRRWKHIPNTLEELEKLNGANGSYFICKGGDEYGQRKRNAN